jgi:hypothetical protein
MYKVFRIRQATDQNCYRHRRTRCVNDDKGYERYIAKGTGTERFPPILTVWALLDPDSYWKCGSGLKLTKLRNNPDFKPFKMAFLST